LPIIFISSRNPPDVRERAAIGRGFFGSEVPDAGLDQDVRYYACLKVWAMRDHNSVCVAQAVHEDVLTTAGAWRPDTAMRYGAPLGPGPFYQGIYIDDLLLLKKTRSTRLETQRPGRTLRFLVRPERAMPRPASPRRLVNRSTLRENSWPGGLKLIAPPAWLAWPRVDVCSCSC
jgi:hypothetical protein